MKSAFADTFYWVALANPRDQWHQEAMSICSDLQITNLVTTDEVLVEFLTQFSGLGAALRSKAVAMARAIQSDSHVRVLPQSRNSFLEGLSLYESRPDKQYSLTDCISMSAMRAEGIVEVLTLDTHFAQEGLLPLFGQ